MNKKLLVGVAAGVSVAALTLTGCSSTASSTGAPSGSPAAEPVKGGNLTWIDVTGQFEATDPAAIYLGEELAGLRRTVYRGLTALTVADDANTKVVGDLATDTGTTPDEGKTWSFTLKDGLKWQDGAEITCADLQYGLSRSYDASLVAGTGVGTTYLAQYDLYDPAAPDYDLSSEYTGPLSGSAEAQAHFEAAASCEGSTITYHFKNAWPDFPYAAASLFTTDPYQESAEKGTAGLWTVNANGPYKLQGDTFDPSATDVLVRNDQYDPATDSTDVRGAYPDTITFDWVADPETITARLIADSGDDAAAFSPISIPSSKYSEISSDLSGRVEKTTSPYTRFLGINSLTLTDPKVRRALVLATDKTGFVQAAGGDNWGTPTSTIVSQSIAGFVENPSTKDDDPAGDPEAAKKLLAEAGQPNPEISYAFSDTPTNEKTAAVLQAGWQKAGFKVTLAPIPTDAKPSYYGQISAKDKNGQKIDVYYSGWASDWPTLFGVVPPILQSNPADATAGVGFNYGFYSNPDVDAAIADATAATDPAKQVAALQKADELAGADGAYVPLANQNNYYIHGSKIGGFLPDIASSYYPDLGGLYVAQ
ncbi:ABC transporter substrate-binding protein [Xylanimonas protaetiae]|nr:ABC transporter substrate-binding protein [Xylanimonas protaetiae]